MAQYTRRVYDPSIRVMRLDVILDGEAWLALLSAARSEGCSVRGVLEQAVCNRIGWARVDYKQRRSRRK